MDKGDLIDNMFWIGDRLSPKGKEFMQKIQSYPATIKRIGGSSIADSEMKENREKVRYRKSIF
jgi:hypothetical protein